MDKNNNKDNKDKKLFYTQKTCSNCKSVVAIKMDYKEQEKAPCPVCGDIQHLSRNKTIMLKNRNEHVDVFTTYIYKKGVRFIEITPKFGAIVSGYNVIFFNHITGMFIEHTKSTLNKHTLESLRYLFNVRGLHNISEELEVNYKESGYNNIFTKKGRAF